MFASCCFYVPISTASIHTPYGYFTHQHTNSHPPFHIQAHKHIFIWPVIPQPASLQKPVHTPNLIHAEHFLTCFVPRQREVAAFRRQIPHLTFTFTFSCRNLAASTIATADGHTHIYTIYNIYNIQTQKPPSRKYVGIGGVYSCVCVYTRVCVVYADGK